MFLGITAESTHKVCWQKDVLIIFYLEPLKNLIYNGSHPTRIYFKRRHLMDCKCGVCGEEIGGNLIILKEHTEEHIIDLIKQENPQ